MRPIFLQFTGIKESGLILVLRNDTMDKSLIQIPKIKMPRSWGRESKPMAVVALSCVLRTFSLPTPRVVI